MTKHFVAQDCTKIGAAPCLVENTIYGYYPNLGVNAFLLAFFAVFAMLQLALAFRKKTWFYGIAIACGCIGEAIGYGGRIMMHSNPFGKTAFTIQISCLIFAPAFIAAGVYLVLKHIVIAFGRSRSRIEPTYITYIFISCDVLSILLQAIGGGMAGGAGDNTKVRDNGTSLMIAGIVWQVGTLVVFAAMAGDYAVRSKKVWNTSAVSAESQSLVCEKKFRFFLVAVTLAFITIFTRCVYRIAEMVGGWASPLMRDEAEFVVLEGFMIVVAVAALTLFHPGYCFPRTSAMGGGKEASLSQSSSDVESIGAATPQQQQQQQQQTEKNANRSPRFLHV